LNSGIPNMRRRLLLLRFRKYGIILRRSFGAPWAEFRDELEFR
jgi:hypothetical protein